MRVFPDYDGRGIVNLISSIQKACGSKPVLPEAINLPSRELKNSENIVLLVIDALGLDYVQKNDSFMKGNVRDELTSVFPSTTAAAMTSLYTGLPPMTHGFLSWFMYIKEFGMMIKPLPFIPRVTFFGRTDDDTKLRSWFDCKTVFEKIKRKSFLITDQEFVGSDYSELTSAGSKVVGYSDLNDMFKRIEQTINKKGKKFVFAYWPGLDERFHEHGVKSNEVRKHYQEIDKKVRRLVKELSGTNTTLIITGDHGMIDIPKKNNLHLEDYPRINDCLSTPLSGGRRTLFCYPKPGRTAEFKRLMGKKLPGLFSVYRSSEIIERGWFGEGIEHPKLSERCGYFILVAKKNHTIRDELFSEKRTELKSMHGALSRDEMLVPLIIFKC